MREHIFLPKPLFPRHVCFPDFIGGYSDYPDSTGDVEALSIGPSPTPVWLVVHRRRESGIGARVGHIQSIVSGLMWVESVLRLLSDRPGAAFLRAQFSGSANTPLHASWVVRYALQTNC